MMSLPIWNDPIMHGLGFAFQSLVVDPGAKAGVASSPGLAVVIGL